MEGEVDEESSEEDKGFTRREKCLFALQVIIVVLILIHYTNPLLFATYSPFHEPDPNACLGSDVEASPESLGLPDASELETNGTDTDGDGLSDDREEEIGTSPIVADTDGDGLVDGVEVRGREAAPNILGDLDPLRHDVLVEVDETQGTNFPEADAERLKQAFADAPVSNPRGDDGVTLHLVVDDAASCVPSSLSIEDYAVHYQGTEFDSKGYGFYHVILVDDVEGDFFTSNMLGIARDGTHGAIVQDQGEGTGATLMHELGHAMGLTDADFHGVDNDELSTDEYPSVMNYNNRDAYEYSSGAGFDDWRYIERNQHYPPTAEIERLLLPDSETTPR